MKKFYEEHPELVKAFLTAQKQVLDEMDADHADTQVFPATAKATGCEEADSRRKVRDFMLSDMEINDSDLESHGKNREVSWKIQA